MPVGTQGDNPPVELDADAPAHAHDHRLAQQVRSPGFPVLDDVGGDRIEAIVGTDDGLLAGPAGLGPLGGFGLGALGDVPDLLVDGLTSLLGQRDLCQAGLVEDPDRRPVLNGAGQVVDVDVLAENLPGGSVGRFDRGAGEAEVRGVRKRIV